MDMKTLMNEMTQEQREALAARVRSSVGYFWQLAGGHKKPGTKLCHRLVEEEPRLTLHELRPDVWRKEEPESASPCSSTKEYSPDANGRRKESRRKLKDRRKE